MGDPGSGCLSTGSKGHRDPSHKDLSQAFHGPPHLGPSWDPGPKRRTGAWEETGPRSWEGTDQAGSPGPRSILSTSHQDAPQGLQSRRAGAVGLGGVMVLEWLNWVLVSGLRWAPRAGGSALGVSSRELSFCGWETCLWLPVLSQLLLLLVASLAASWPPVGPMTRRG